MIKKRVEKDNINKIYIWEKEIREWEALEDHILTKPRNAWRKRD
jgi:hypothetical protein